MLLHHLRDFDIAFVKVIKHIIYLYNVTLINAIYYIFIHILTLTNTIPKRPDDGAEAPKHVAAIVI